MFRSGFIRKLFLGLALPLAVQAQENITLEQYAALPVAQRDQTVIKIADKCADYYDFATAKRIKYMFNTKVPGGDHSWGVDRINYLVNAVAEKQNIHSASLNTLIGRYLIAEYGTPPSLQK